MANVRTYYCWRCYGANRVPVGACASCGRPIEKPPETSYVEQLIWALGHPLPGTQMIAAQVLGERGEPAAAGPLRALVQDAADPFLAAQALRSLVSIAGVDGTRDLLEPLAKSGAPAVQAVAMRALFPG